MGASSITGRELAAIQAPEKLHTRAVMYDLPRWPSQTSSNIASTRSRGRIKMVTIRRRPRKNAHVWLLSFVETRPRVLFCVHAWLLCKYTQGFCEQAA